MVSPRSFRHSEPSAHVDERKHHQILAATHAEIFDYSRYFSLCYHVQTFPIHHTYQTLRAFSTCELTRRAPTPASLQAPAVVYEYSMAQYRAMRNVWSETYSKPFPRCLRGKHTRLENHPNATERGQAGSHTVVRGRQPCF
jgi:hypothetical protein